MKLAVTGANYLTLPLLKMDYFHPFQAAKLADC
jgi:hypothetical protein